ncbi:MAG: hypothetical protein JXR61_12310 [Prolixibacteraceae bacterium]|nr:hypothetical protein [Prolixibacteraceae bacterium]
MKTTMKQLAAGTILALLISISINVNAKGKEALKASNFESIETTMELESWMIDSEIWDGTEAFIFEEIAEEILALEDWMVCDENWIDIENMRIETQYDIDLKLESWMTNSVVWNR